MTDLGSGTIYTETVVYSPPEAYVNDVPYQLAIVELDGRPADHGARGGRARTYRGSGEVRRVPQQRSLLFKKKQS